MDLKLHANATTTPRIRAYIQKSSASIAALARELGIHNRTVARWKARTQVLDRSTRPHRLATTMTDWEEALIVELRRSLALPLDDITEAMRRCVNPRLSRSAIHRCLQRHAISARLTPDKAPAAAFQTAAPAGFIHIDVKYLPPLNRRRSYAYVAIDRATRFVYLEILPDRRAQTAAGFLDRFRASFPLEIHTILTDNGSEFTDRFAVNKKGKPPDKPSGQHPFDRLCARHAITHRLTRPFRPQTNGMVERFNRRLGDHLDRMPQNRAAHHRRFLDHAERDAYLHTFVADYNRTRLHCLDYHAPAELLAKLMGHNTKAGGLDLDHAYKAMAWLGAVDADGRSTAEEVEEALYRHRQPLFGTVSIAFFDTTSLWFEGAGGESLGQRGHSKDYRGHLKQVVLGIVLDGRGPADRLVSDARQHRRRDDVGAGGAAAARALRDRPGLHRRRSRHDQRRHHRGPRSREDRIHPRRARAHQPRGPHRNHRG